MATKKNSIAMLLGLLIGSNAWATEITGTWMNGAQAPFEQGNAENVIKAMRKSGKGSSQVGWLGFNGSVAGESGNTTTMTHSAGLIPCSILAANFFKGTPLQEMPQLKDPE
jgi:hypothetical protein